PEPPGAGRRSLTPAFVHFAANSAANWTRTARLAGPAPDRLRLELLPDFAETRLCRFGARQLAAREHAAGPALVGIRAAARQCAQAAQQLLRLALFSRDCAQLAHAVERGRGVLAAGCVADELEDGAEPVERRAERRWVELWSGRGALIAQRPPRRAHELARRCRNAAA